MICLRKLLDCDDQLGIIFNKQTDGDSTSFSDEFVGLPIWVKMDKIY